jgi:hypothetical protein
LLSKNIKIEIHRNIMLSVLLHGQEIWSATLRGDHTGKTLENSVLRKKSGPKRDEVRGSGEDYIMRNFVICIHKILLG